ncbi:MAG: class I SAM-dependent methyltransferase, partial [Nitrospinae bacterium]|nr:class I SAM-dependent methyltransferase [Nitrospinota bacterium]
MANPGAAEHYNEDYFNWQKNIGAFGGKANLFKFNKTVKSSDTVIDFGCGGGYLLANLNCRTRIGIEPNESASNAIDKNGVKHFFSPKQCLDELGESCTDVIISDNALEHTLNPLEELKSLYPLLKGGGTIHFIVPCHSIGDSSNPKDTNYHLYSWS